MKIKGINIIEEALKRNNGEDAVISISHKLYGNQTLKCKLNCIFNEERIGFHINNQEIYVYKDLIVDYGIEDGIYFADDLMGVKIKLNRQ